MMSYCSSMASHSVSGCVQCECSVCNVQGMACPILLCRWFSVGLTLSRSGSGSISFSLRRCQQVAWLGGALL